MANASSASGSKRLSIGESGIKSRSTWQTRGSSLTSGKSVLPNKVHFYNDFILLFYTFKNLSIPLFLQNNTFYAFQSGNSSILHVSSSMGSLDTFNESDGLNPSGQNTFYNNKSRPSILLPILGCGFLLVIYITCGAAFIADTQNINFR